jgi:hypothetical protein
MAEKSEPQRQAAFAASASANDCASIIGLGSAVVGGGLSLLLPPVGFGVGVALAVTAFAFQRKGSRLARAGNDPPDPRYSTPVRVASQHINLELLGDDPVSVAARGPVDAVLKASNYLSAMVRAMERADGAEEANDAHNAYLRSAEASGFAVQAGTELDRFVEQAPQLVDAIRALPPLPGDRGGDAEPLLRDSLPDDVLGHLYKMGVPWSGLAIEINAQAGNVTPLMAEALEASVAADREFKPLLLSDVFGLTGVDIQARPRGWARRREETFTVVTSPRDAAPTAEQEIEAVGRVREGETISEIAEQMGLSEEAARSMLRTALERSRDDQRLIEAALEPPEQPSEG